MNNTTGIGLTLGVIVYFMYLFLFFSQAPTELIYGHSMSGVRFNQTQTVDTGISSDEVNVIQIFSDFALFNIEGLPEWLTIIAVYVPIIILFVGIYGLVRGI